ncbi:MAG: ABC transporter ATP-binding protein [Acetobacteraceae bacterium]|jgi:ABC-type branched-subunit amino acid transport system ATPase component
MNPVLQVDGVTVRFAGLLALSDVSFSLAPGFIQAVIGPNGAGKSTLFGVISGYVKPESGRVTFANQDLTGWPPTAIARAGMRRTFQNGGIFRELTVLENVLTGIPQAWDFRIAATALRLPGIRRREAAAIGHARETLDRLGIADIADRVAGELPAGQQRLVEIARTIAARTQILLLDEPAVGLTLGELDRLGAVLRQLAAEGVSVLLVEHVIDFVMALGERILVLNHGEIIASGTPDEIRSHDAVLEAYLGRK